jgi:hypothetical protein
VGRVLGNADADFSPAQIIVPFVSFGELAHEGSSKKLKRD